MVRCLTFSNATLILISLGIGIKNAGKTKVLERTSGINIEVIENRVIRKKIIKSMEIQCNLLNLLLAISSFGSNRNSFKQ